MVFTTTDPKDNVEIRMGTEGPAARPPMTVNAVLAKTVADNADKVAVRVKREGAWKEWTWTEYLAEANRVAKALVALGVNEREAVAIIGRAPRAKRRRQRPRVPPPPLLRFNSPEWVFTWVGAVMCGCLGTGVYATNGPDGVAYVVEHSKARVVVAENEKQIAKFRSVDAARLSSVLAFVAYMPGEAVPPPVATSQSFNWDGFLASGSGVSDASIATRSAAVVPGQCCSLIYTSGTTGHPKAVMISHDSRARRVCRARARPRGIRDPRASRAGARGRRGPRSSTCTRAPRRSTSCPTCR